MHNHQPMKQNNIYIFKDCTGHIVPLSCPVDLSAQNYNPSEIFASPAGMRFITRFPTHPPAFAYLVANASAVPLVLFLLL